VGEILAWRRSSTSNKGYADWFAHWLKGEAAPGGDPVKLFVIGENRWMTAASYPPPGQPKKYFLGSDFALLPDRGDSRRGSDQYVYDPGDPTPSPLERLTNACTGLWRELFTRACSLI
jgi:predicted acyl esterase